MAARLEGRTTDFSALVKSGRLNSLTEEEREAAENSGFPPPAK